MFDQDQLHPYEASNGPGRWVEREQSILARCEGKIILHLGCLCETERSTAERVSHFLSERSLHSQLLRVGQDVVGIDIDAEAIDKVRGLSNRRIYVGNVERLAESTMPVDFRPDLILAGDLIEHLSNPGAMLDAVAAWLSPTSDLLLTTPNAFGLPNYLRFLLGRFREGSEHLQTYTIFTLTNLLARHGYYVHESFTCWQGRSASAMQKGLVARVLFKLGSRLLRRLPRLGGTLLVVARKSVS